MAVPKVNLSFWNDDTSVLWHNNCYNYSTNRITNSFAQPGEASGHIYQDLTCESVIKAASKDLGLTVAEPFEQKSKLEETLIALVVAPGYDFHWYRRDDNRYWSHKPGSTEATTKDQNEELITDPETADRGFYTDFCGYFKINNYIGNTSEQDAGYVRIGTMLELPEYEETHIPRVAPPSKNSEVEILIYSGRKNPRLPLQAFLESPAHKASLRTLASRLDLEASSVLVSEKSSRLGYNGLLIRDHQGLVFPKGTTVHMKGKAIVAYLEGTAPRSLILESSDLEDQFRLAFMPAGL